MNKRHPRCVIRMKRLDLISSDRNDLFCKLNRKIKKYRKVFDDEIVPDFNQSSALSQRLSFITKNYGQQYAIRNRIPIYSAEAAHSNPECLTTQKNDDDIYSDPRPLKSEKANKIDGNIGTKEPGPQKSEANFTFRNANILGDLKPIEKLRTSAILNEGIVVDRQKTNEEHVDFGRYSFKNYKNYCSSHFKHLEPFQNIISDIAFELQESGSINEEFSNSKIPTCAEIISAHDNWYRLGQLEKHYAIICLIPLIASYNIHSNYREILKFIKRLAYNRGTGHRISPTFLLNKHKILFEPLYTFINNHDEESTASHELKKQKIFEIVKMFVSEFRTICLTGPIKSYINIFDNKATEFSSLDSLIVQIDKLLAMPCGKEDQLVSNQYKSAYAYYYSVNPYLYAFDVTLGHQVADICFSNNELIHMTYDCHAMQKMLIKNYVDLAKLDSSTQYIGDNFGNNQNFVMAKLDEKMKADFCRDVLVSFIKIWKTKMQKINASLDKSRIKLNMLDELFEEYINKKSNIIKTFTQKNDVILFAESILHNNRRN